MTDQERYAKLEKLYGQLKSAYSLLTDKDSRWTHSLYRDSGMGGYSVLSLTMDEVAIIANWKIVAIEEELEALNDVRRTDV